MGRDIIGTAGITTHDPSDNQNAQSRMTLRRSHAVQKDNSVPDATRHNSSPRTAKAIGMHDAPARQTRRQHAAIQGNPITAPAHDDANPRNTEARQPTRRTGSVRDERNVFVTNGTHSRRTASGRHDVTAMRNGAHDAHATTQGAGRTTGRHDADDWHTSRHATHKTTQTATPHETQADGRQRNVPRREDNEHTERDARHNAAWTSSDGTNAGHHGHTTQAKAGYERHAASTAATQSVTASTGTPQNARDARDPVMTTFYAIAGLLVVASHAHGAIDIASNTLPLYSYQIGMFLFASGWFYHERHERHPIAWAWRRIKRLIVPLFAINAAYGVIGNLIAPIVGFEFVPPMSLDTLVRQPMLGGDMFMLDNPLWFVFPFFCATTIDFAVHAVLDTIRDAIARDKASGTGITIDIGLAVAYTLAFAVIGTLPGFVSPPPSSKHALMVRVLFMLPLIAYGRVVSHHVPRIAKANARTSVLMIFVSLCVALLMDTLIGDTAFLAAQASFPAGPMPPLITSMCGTIAWLGVSQLIGDKVGRLPSTDTLARSTMSLMANQIAGFELLNLLFIWLDSIGIVSGFDTQKFATDIWYELRPVMPNTVNGAQVWDAFGFLYLIAGVLFAMLLSGISRRIGRAFRQRNGRHNGNVPGQ